MGLDLCENGSSQTMYDQGESKPGCRIVLSVTIVWLTTEADDQSSLHCVIVSTDVMSDNTERRDASRGGGCSKISAYKGQFGWASMIWSILSVAALRCREGGATLAEHWQPWELRGLQAAWNQANCTMKLGVDECKLALLLGPILQYCPLLLRHQTWLR